MLNRSSGTEVTQEQWKDAVERIEPGCTWDDVHRILHSTRSAAGGMFVLVDRLHWMPEVDFCLSGPNEDSPKDFHGLSLRHSKGGNPPVVAVHKSGLFVLPHMRAAQTENMRQHSDLTIRARIAQQIASDERQAKGSSGRLASRMGQMEVQAQDIISSVRTLFGSIEAHVYQRTFNVDMSDLSAEDVQVLYVDIRKACLDLEETLQELRTGQLASSKKTGTLGQQWIRVIDATASALNTLYAFIRPSRRTGPGRVPNSPGGDASPA